MENIVDGKAIFLLWVSTARVHTFLLIALVNIALVNNSVISVAAAPALYDFIEHAPDAQWSSGAGALPFPGDPSDSRGFARYVLNARLEDGSTWSKVLETHPQWVSGGWIMGVYPQQTVPANSQLTVRVGFLAGATGTDGVKFDVYFDEYRGLNVAPLRHTIVSKVADFDSKLDAVTSDLSFLAGKKGSFVLYVYAGKTSDRDWAVWAEARIEAKPLPDLVVTDVWESGGTIHYKVKNVGNAATATKSFCNCLYVDGKQVAKHCLTTVLQPSQEAEGVFDYAWQPTPGEHIVKVCADCDQYVEESNEGNNCLEEKWVKENLPDLVVVEIKFDADKSLIGYVLKNAGSEVAKGGHSTTLYVDGKEVAHDLVDVDLSPAKTFESWFKDYKVLGKASIKVKVCADNYNQVKELDERNNCLERVLDMIPPTVAVTHTPVNVTWFDKVTFSAMATDDTEVTRIAIYLNGSRVKECISPLRSLADGKYHCSYEGGPFQAGILNVTAEAFDPAGNRGVCEEDINVTVRIYLPPTIRMPRLCRITGKIYNFPYNPDTLKIKICEAELICAYRINPLSMEQEFSCNCQCKRVSPTPERPGAGWTYSWIEYVDVSRAGEFQTYEYSIIVPCNGTYLLEPVYSPCPGGQYTPECECPWRGTWSASKGFCVSMDGKSQEGFDFTFNPLDTTTPSVTIQFSSEHPRVGDDVEVIVTAIDSVEIEHITLSLTEITYINGSRGAPRVYQFLPSTFAENSLHPEQYPWIHRVVVRWKIPWKDVYRITFEAWACDQGGNVGILPPRSGVNRKTLEFGCPGIITFDFENGGRLIRSTNFPIFGLPDEDEDGLNDCWESAVAEAVNPYIELDEKEDLLSTRMPDHAVNFVRITPYPSRENPTHILFYFVAAWTRDYGKTYCLGDLCVTQEAHPGDTEPFVMAWRIVDKQTLFLEYVYIEAHGSCNKHRDLWSGVGVSCNMEPFCDILSNVKGQHKTCSQLQFKDNKLYLYASEDKHALYPSCEACESEVLVDIDQGLVDYVKCVLATLDLFGCALYALGNSILTELIDFLYKALTAPFDDEYLGMNMTFYAIPNLLRESSNVNIIQEVLEFKGDTGSPCVCDDCHYHYFLATNVLVDALEEHGYSRDKPHVRIYVGPLWANDLTCDWHDYDQIYLIITGFSIHNGEVDVWRVGEFFISPVYAGRAAGVYPPYVVFDGEIDSSYVIGFTAILYENDEGNPNLGELGEKYKSEVEEMLRAKVKSGECDGISDVLLWMKGVVDEDCAGGGARLFHVYNVGEPNKLVLNNLDGTQKALGGKELAYQDRFLGESIEGKFCPKGDRVFCGGTGSSSCDCGTSILQMMGVKWNNTNNSWDNEVPEKLRKALEARPGGGG